MSGGDPRTMHVNQKGYPIDPDPRTTAAEPPTLLERSRSGRIGSEGMRPKLLARQRADTTRTLVTITASTTHKTVDHQEHILLIFHVQSTHSVPQVIVQ